MSADRELIERGARERWTLARFREEYAAYALRTFGNAVQVAQYLGVPRSTVRGWIARHQDRQSAALRLRADGSR